MGDPMDEEPSGVNTRSKKEKERVSDIAGVAWIWIEFEFEFEFECTLEKVWGCGFTIAQAQEITKDNVKENKMWKILLEWRDKLIKDEQEES